MYHLLYADYERARPVFAGLRYNLAIDAMLDGNTPAWVYVDDIYSPRTAWMWDLQGEMYIAGYAGSVDLSRMLARVISGRVLPYARAHHIPRLTLCYDNPAWESHLGAIFPGLKTEPARHRYYTFSKPILDWQAVQPAGSEILRIDEALLARRDLRNIEMLTGWVDSFWRTRADFENTGFGFALLQGDVVISCCLSVFVSGKARELGLETVPEYRGQGYATAVAARSVAFCADLGLTPHWHSEEENISSWRVAERIGFVNPTGYMVYRVYA
ncbi:MAG: GNAT family N-acetyltransferase [Anaerolineae bacterium]|nr:GNAT family N-acetyltransferase [Anaerolineae bacterium]